MWPPSLFSFHPSETLIFYLYNSVGLFPLFFQLWFVSRFPPGSKPCSHHLSPSDFRSYKNPQCTPTQTPNSHFLLANISTIHCPILTVSYITQLTSQKRFSNSFNSTENKTFQIIFITVFNITLSSKCTVLWATHLKNLKTKSHIFSLLFHHLCCL